MGLFDKLSKFASQTLNEAEEAIKKFSQNVKSEDNNESTIKYVKCDYCESSIAVDDNTSHCPNCGHSLDITKISAQSSKKNDSNYKTYDYCVIVSKDDEEQGFIVEDIENELESDCYNSVAEALDYAKSTLEDILQELYDENGEVKIITENDIYNSKYGARSLRAGGRIKHIEVSIKVNPDLNEDKDW